MPRPKRTLAEVDTNTEPATAAKKVLTGRGKAKGKENEIPVTKRAPLAKAASKKSTTSKAKKATKKKARDNETNSPVSQIAPMVEVADNGENEEAAPANVTVVVKSSDGKKDAMAFPDSKKSVPPTKASDTRKVETSSKASSTARDKNSKVARDTGSNTWICVCRPASEIEKEEDLDEDFENTVDTRDGGKKCLCFRAADDHPEHKWIVTEKGFELMKEWMYEADNRCPDLFRMYISNDFHGYGICEVIENMFLDFAKEQDKNTQDPLAMWSIMEGMVSFLRCYGLITWHMLDDSEGNAKRIMLIGTSLLTTIDVLIRQGLFTNNSSQIRNLGLILSMFLQFAEDEDELPSCNEDGWKAVVVEKADAHGVTIQGLVGIDELVQNIRDNGNDSDLDEEDIIGMDPKGLATYMSDCYRSRGHSYRTIDSFKRSWKQYCWDIELEAYRSTQVAKDDIGGDFYDLTAEHNQGPHMKMYKLGGARSRWL